LQAVEQKMAHCWRTLALLALGALLLYTGGAAAAASKDDRWTQLSQLVDKNTNVLTFTSVNSYAKYVQNTGRNYDIFVMLVRT
jgi:hypothetical protein